MAKTKTEKLKRYLKGEFDVLSPGEKSELALLSSTLKGELSDFKKYIDHNLSPILDVNGNVLYEVEVLSKASPEAQQIGRVLFVSAVIAERQKVAHLKSLR